MKKKISTPKILRQILNERCHIHTHTLSKKTSIKPKKQTNNNKTKKFRQTLQKNYPDFREERIAVKI